MDQATLDRRRLLLGALASAGYAGCIRRELLVEGVTELEPITPIGQFYVYQCCGTPIVDADRWRLEIRNGTLDLAEIDRDWLSEQRAIDVELTLQCIGSSPAAPNIGNAVWGGLPLLQVLDTLGVAVPDNAVEMVLRGADDYHAAIPIEDLESPVWLVWRMNDESLPDDHGAPARLLVPGRYGVTNVKWLTSITFTSSPHVGYWDEQGWSKEAVYKPNGFILIPSWGSDVEAPVTIMGTAFAGRDPIVRVEITDDGGETWTDATLDYAPGPDIWALWSLVWERPPGRYDLQVRVHTAGGQSSTLKPDGTDLSAGFDGGSIVPVTVTD